MAYTLNYGISFLVKGIMLLFFGVVVTPEDYIIPRRLL